MVIVELKSVENLQPVHFKQLLTYLCLVDIGIRVNYSKEKYEASKR